MRRVSLEAFRRAPLGSCVLSGPALVFCDSPELCGAVAWGTPSAQDARALVSLGDLYQRPDILASRFDVVLDASTMDRVDTDMLEIMVRWLGEHRAALLGRVRMQASVAPPGISGYVLTGILPLVGPSHPFRMFPSLRDALVEVAGARGAELASELHAIVMEAQGLDPTRRRLRDLLRERRGGLDIHAAAAALSVSSRSLQRLLAAAGTSFKDEQLDARFALACEMLEGTDAKVADVADRVHISERALTTLFRSKCGCTPAEYRRHRPRS